MKPSATFPGGFTLAPAEQWEIDYVEDHYREGERHEREVENAPPTSVGDFERCWTVRAANGDIVYKDYMQFSLTMNHMVIDGAPGARFLQTLKDIIENFELVCIAGC